MEKKYTIIFIKFKYSDYFDYEDNDGQYTEILDVLKNMNKSDHYQEIDGSKILYNVILNDYEITGLMILKRYLSHKYYIHMIVIENIDKLILTHENHIRQLRYDNQNSDYPTYFKHYYQRFNMIHNANELSDKIVSDTKYIIHFAGYLVFYYHNDVEEVIKYLNSINNILNIECNIVYTKCEPKTLKT